MKKSTGGMISMGVGAFSILLAAHAPAQPAAAPQSVTPPPAQVVASFNEQLTGVAVSQTGRIFVNFPYWSSHHTNSVVEVIPGPKGVTTEPFPNGIWNEASAAMTDPGHRFVCVQSVYADADDKLWVLDPAAPYLATVLPGGAKLVKIDLKSNTVERIYSFDATIAPPNSYLNDVRVDTIRHFAYITDSGIGAIVVLDLNTGKARRVLEQAPQTLGTNGLVISIDGHQLRNPDGTAFTINCDGIALDLGGNTLYFQAPTSGRLYSVPTDALRNEKLSPQALLSKVDFVANIGPADGFCMGPGGALFVTSVEDNSVKCVNPSVTPPITIVADDPRLVWPDSIACGPDGWLYVTASQIPRMPRFNGGQDLAQLPYQLFRVPLELGTSDATQGLGPTVPTP